jgi:hypothetical protein
VLKGLEGYRVQVEVRISSDAESIDGDLWLA